MRREEVLNQSPPYVDVDLYASDPPLQSAVAGNGEATVSNQDPLLAHTVGAQLIVRVTARAIFPNCPRYIPAMQWTEPSVYAPRAGCEPPEPAWKNFPDFKDCVPPRRRRSRDD